MRKIQAFTLTEVLLAIVIVGVIAALVLPSVVTSFQQEIMNHQYSREVNAIHNALDNLTVAENKSSFFSTMMYLDSEPSTYKDSSGKFIKKYLRIAHDCGDSNGSCFADTYYEFKNNDKVVYKPDYKGACAQLKNGSSLCLIPQIAANKIEGIIDLNGPKGPNVYGKDLRPFSFEPKTRTSLSHETEEILFMDEDPIKDEEPPEVTPPTPPQDPCTLDKNSLDCCKTRAITSSTDVCCTYEDIKNSNPVCKTTCSKSYSINCQTNNMLHKAYCTWYKDSDVEMSLKYDCTFFVPMVGTAPIASGTWNVGGNSHGINGENSLASWTANEPNVSCSFTNLKATYKGKTYSNLSFGSHSFEVPCSN